MFPNIESILVTGMLVVVGLAIIGLFKVGLGALMTKREKYNARREVVTILLAEITQRAAIHQNPAVVQQLTLWRADVLNRANAGRSVEDIIGASLDMHRVAVLKLQVAEHGQRMQQALNDHERINHMARFDVNVRHHNHSWSVTGEGYNAVNPNVRAALDEHRHLVHHAARAQEQQ